MRVLVFGGRSYAHWARLSQVLSTYHAECGFDLLIHGNAGWEEEDGRVFGADRMAGRWAHDSGIQVVVFPADWKAYGRSAGPKRNQRMIDEAEPQLAVAFPGGRGTADMTRRVEQARIPVVCIDWRSK